MRRHRHPDTVEIKSRAFWVKVIEMLVQNYALVDATPDGAHVWFIAETGGVFDELHFASVAEAEAGLRYNGFWLHGEEPNDHEYLAIPTEPFVLEGWRGHHPYSSGEYWREPPGGSLRLRNPLFEGSRMNQLQDNPDPHDLNRYVLAQRHTYDKALSEIRRGHKESHWMWFVFPQFVGLGTSSTSKRFAIKSLAEAEAYLRHEVLGPRLLACFEALIQLESRSASGMFGFPDNMKLHSCATLFAAVAPHQPVFERVLDEFFGGQRCAKTLDLMRCPGPLAHD